MTLESAVRGVVLISNVILTATYAAAWVIFERGITWGAASPVQVHLALAGIGVLFSLFSNLCVIFYFVGTGVWMKDQAKEILAQDRAKALRVWNFYERGNKLKGKAFPFPTMGLVFGLFTFILGGATQVGAIPSWLHPLLATIFLLLAWGGLPLIFGALKTNVELLDGVSDEIDASTPIS